MALLSGNDSRVVLHLCEMVYYVEVVITCGHKLPIFPVRVACVGCFCKGVFTLESYFLSDSYL